MRSHADGRRVAIERAVRALTLIVLGFAAWSATRPLPERAAAGSTLDTIGDSLDRWTAAPPPAVHLSLAAAPNAWQRDWMRALRHAGTQVSWSADGGGIPPLAVEVAPVAGPRGGTMLSIAAPAGAGIAVVDEVASIDTVTAARGGARLFVPMASGALTAVAGNQRASARVRDTLLPRRVLVLGRTTWEAKFIIAALEESGWEVDARLAVAPGVDVTQGATRAPDTARHAALIVLDDPPTGATSAVARYVRAGGGAILSGGAASVPALTDINAGRVGARVRPSAIAFAEDAPRRALGFLAMTPRDDAIVLEEHDGRAAAAARRVDAGRVLQLGYDETWRWRLGGGAAALEAHRAWWNGLVAGVAYRAAAPVSPDALDDPAPLAHLVNVLGPSSVAPRSPPRGGPWAPSPALLFALVCTLLLAELASRRMRGAP